MKKVLLFLTLVANIAWASNGLAYSWTISFSGAGPLAGTYQFGTPIAAYPSVTSKWNQPRAVTGTNPHQGVDLTAALNTRVDAVCNGTVTEHPGAYELILLCDTNGNGQADDDLRVKYDHLNKVDVVPDGTYVSKGTYIALSGDEGGVYKNSPHLHFGAKANRGDGNIVWVRNEPYYRWNTSKWNAGNDLDFISLARWNGGNTAVVKSYARDENGYHGINYGDVVIFHRRPGDSLWSSENMSKSGDDFSFNLGTIYQSGTPVQWMVRSTRTDLSTSYYRVGFFIPKYAQPNENPNAVSYKYDYYSCTIGGSCTETRTTP